jgi:hypothetical protein
MPEWLEKQIRNGQDKRMAVKIEEGKEDYIEIEETILKEIEDSAFISRKFSYLFHQL